MSSESAPQQEISPSEHRPLSRLVLTGFMGSGKTTVGRLLAERLDWRFIDLDGAIEQRDGRKVSAIFAESGEPEFRRLETAELRLALAERGVVVALGGGALETTANRDLLAAAPETAVVLLSAPFSVLYDRCVRQNASEIANGEPVRPLLGDPQSAAARLARREASYREAATVIIESSGQTPDETAASVLSLLRIQARFGGLSG